jgi:hypothetical protein
MNVYSFVEQLERGKAGEDILDEYFSKWYQITCATLQEEKRGIDRFFLRDEITTAVEYKTDDKTSKTGNVFVETYSNLERNKFGWAWTCQADILIYFALPDTLYIVKPHVIREHIDEWLEKYGIRTVKNRGWTSVGIAVAEEDFSTICESVRRLT